MVTKPQQHNYDIAKRIYTVHQLGENENMNFFKNNKEHFSKSNSLMITGTACNTLALDLQKEFCNNTTQRKLFALLAL